MTGVFCTLFPRRLSGLCEICHLKSGRGVWYIGFITSSRRGGWDVRTQSVIISTLEGFKILLKFLITE